MDDRVKYPNRIGVWTVCGLLALVVAARPIVPAHASELRETPTVRAVKAAWPSVVSIRGEKTVAGPSATAVADASRRVNGMGTGVVIDPNGYIVTNYHVVQGVREINVTLTDGSEYTANLLARDAETDLAIIKIQPTESLTTIGIGTSSDLMIAEPVIAIGNPYGYSQTVTTGIISSLHRALQVSDAQYYDDLIQTDASINPGNSGGPLLNIDGRMIGVTVAVRTGAQGIAFAIPVDTVVEVLARLLEERVSARFHHGIQLAASDHCDAGSDSLSGPLIPVSLVTSGGPARSTVVQSVDSGSSAEKAGLMPGDKIIRIGEETVGSEFEFHRSLLAYDPEDAVSLTVQRGDALLECDLRLESTSMTWSVLGMDLAPISPEDFRQRFEKTIYRGGLSVVRVRQDGPAAAKGVEAGDVLVGLHLWETVSLGNIQFILSRPDFEQLNPLKFTILRDGRALYGYMQVPVQTTATASYGGSPAGGGETVSPSTAAIQLP